MRAKDDLTTCEPRGRDTPGPGCDAPGSDRDAPKPQPQRPGQRPAEASAPPLLLVDIDGVISLFSFERETPPQGSFHWIDGMPHYLSAAAAEHLLALEDTFELVWASGWEERANEYLPHLLGLPALPHLRFERTVGRANAHWKLDAIDAYAGERALAWVDDAFNDACHEWARARAAPTLLVHTEPASGITAREVELLRRWARSPAAG